MEVLVPENNLITHLQIAELVNSRPADVSRSIKKLASKGVIAFTASSLTRANARDGELLQLNERDSYVVVAQISPEFTAKLVDFWQSMVNEVAHNIPQTYSEALRFAADLAEEKAALEQKVIQDAPKVEFVENFVEFGQSKCFRDAAGILGVKQNYFTKMLIAHNIVYKKGSEYRAKSEYAQYFELKTGSNTYTDKATGLPATKDYNQLRVNNSGLVYLAKRFGSPELKAAAEVPVVHAPALEVVK